HAGHHDRDHRADHLQYPAYLERAGGMKILSLAAAALLVSACADAMPEIRPLPGHAAADILPFDSVYAAGKAHLAANRVGLAVVMFRRALAIDPLSVAALN